MLPKQAPVIAALNKSTMYHTVEILSYKSHSQNCVVKYLYLLQHVPCLFLSARCSQVSSQQRCC